MMNAKRLFLYRIGLSGLLSAAMLCVMCGALGASQKRDIDGTRAVLEKWVETRRILSQEKRDFELAKQMLAERIELVQREIHSLREKIGQAEDAIAEMDKKRAEMAAENDALKAASASLVSVVGALEDHTRQLLTRLPDPIRERVKPLSQRLPENVDDTKQTISMRFQNIVGILNEINKFNREITITSEVRTLSDGSSVEVTALYIGISRGYYIGANGTVAGVGAATADGWVWMPDNAAAPAIADAVAILKNEKIASFVHLPLDLN